MAEQHDNPQAMTNETSSKGNGELNKDAAAPSSLKRKLDENAAPGAKRSRTDKNDTESALDPEADYNDKISNQAKPRSNASKGRAKPTKQTNASGNEQSSAKSKATTKQSAPTKKPAPVKQPATNKKTAAAKKPAKPKKPRAAGKSAAVTRKASPKGSSTSTEEQIEVRTSKPILIQNDPADYSNIDPELRPKPDEESASTTTPKTLQPTGISHTEKLQSLAQAGVVTLQMNPPVASSPTKKHWQMKDLIQQNSGDMTPTAQNRSQKVASQAPIAPMARTLDPKVKATGSAAQISALRDSTDTIQVVVSKEQQTSKAQQTNAGVREDLAQTNIKPSQAVTSPKDQTPRTQQTDDMAQERSIQKATEMPKITIYPKPQILKAKQANDVAQSHSMQKPAQVQKNTAFPRDQNPETQQTNTMVQGQYAQKTTEVQKEAALSEDQEPNSRQKEVTTQNRVEQLSIDVQQNTATPDEQSFKAQREYDVTRDRAAEKAADIQKTADVQRDIATPKNQSPQTQPTNDASQDHTASTTTIVQVDVASPKQQIPEAQATDNTKRKRPATTAPKPRKPAAARQSKTKAKKQTKNGAPNSPPQADPDVPEDIASTQHQGPQMQPTIDVPQDAQGSLMQTDADLQRDIASHQRDSPRPQQIDSTSTNQPIRPNAVSQGTATEHQQNLDSNARENTISERPQASASQRLEADKPLDEVSGSPGSMTYEYSQLHLQEVKETALYDHGFQWNEILQSREELLEYKGKIILIGRLKTSRHSRTECPLSAKGKKTIRVLGSDRQLDSLNLSRVSQNMQKYQTEPNIPPEFIQGDLCSLIIPRLIRYIHLIYTKDAMDTNELEVLDSLSILLKRLGELCKSAIEMEKRSQDYASTVLLGLAQELEGPLDQISESSYGIIKVIDRQRRLLFEQQLKVREEEKERWEQQREEIRRQEEEYEQEKTVIRRREQERRYLARLTSQARAKKQRSDQYWQHELPSSHSVLSEILLTENPADRVEQRNPNKRRAVSGSFVWSGPLTDVLIDELRKHQDLDIHDRYEQCLKREPLRHLSIGEIRRRALEVKPWLAEQWLEMKGSVPLYVWTIE